MSEVLHITGHILTGPDTERTDIWVAGGRIRFTAPQAPATRTIHGWALPGFVDAHCHIGLGPDGAVTDATAKTQADTDRDAGTLLVRDAGVVSDTRWLQRRDDASRIIRCGRHIARTGRYLRYFAEEVEPADLVEAVRKQARASDGWVKLVGDWIDRSTGDLAPAFDPATVAAAVAAAHAEGARVTAHCFAEQTLDDMLDAGIDCIEHATGMLPRHIPRFVDQGVAVVPTLINIATFTDIAARAEAKFPAYAAHMRDLHARRHETVHNAWAAGVPIYTGTDAGSTIAHGRIGDEIVELANAGLPASAALDAATWAARDWLGAAAIDDGADADLVVLDADPRHDVARVRSPAQVILRGHVLDEERASR